MAKINDAELDSDLIPELDAKGKAKKYRRREWFFTIFPLSEQIGQNWIEAVQDILPVPENARFMTHQVEKCPETGRIHIHALVQFKVPVRFEAAKKMFNNSPNVQIVRNSVYAKDYCNKTDSRLNGPWTWGEFLTQGQKICIPKLMEQVQDGMTTWEMLQANPSIAFCPSTVRFVSEAYKDRKRPRPKRDVTVYILWGESGVGKTHRGKYYRNIEDSCTVQLKKKNPWDKYSCESVLIIDEFDENDCTIQEYNRILDCWDYVMSARYSDKHAHWDTVFITANSDPVTWFRGKPRPLIDAFFRRVKFIFEVRHKDDILNFETGAIEYFRPNFVPADNYE